MATEHKLDWVAIDADPRFQELHRQKSRFLWKLMAISVIYYFLLPIGSAYWPQLFKAQVWGPVNFGILFALSQFAVAWLIAYIYCKKASSKFDPMAQELARKTSHLGELP
jgi:uncharacterized membrane protein (DUF485 family)